MPFPNFFVKSHDVKVVFRSKKVVFRTCEVGFHDLEVVLHGIEVVFRTYEVGFRTYEVVLHACEVGFRSIEVGLHGAEVVLHDFNDKILNIEVGLHGAEVVFRNAEVVSRSPDLFIRTNEVYPPGDGAGFPNKKAVLQPDKLIFPALKAGVQASDAGFRPENVR